MSRKLPQQAALQNGLASPLGVHAASLAALTLGLLAAIAVLVAGAPYIFKRTTLESEIARQLRATTGFTLSSWSSGRFVLLPRPHVVMNKLHVTDAAGGDILDADALDGDVRFLPLIVGRIELSSIVLEKPRLVIDLDNGAIGPNSVIGRAVHDSKTAGGGQPLGILTLVDGTVSISDSAHGRWPILKAVNATLDWRDLESPATLTGSLRVHDVPMQLAAWIAQPSNLMRSDHSAVALHLKAEPLDLSSNGDFDPVRPAFQGHVSAKATSITRLLELFGSDASPLAPLADVTFDSDINATADPRGPVSVDMQSLTMRADGNAYEGTLALEMSGRPSLSGTLATDQLTLAPFLERLPRLVENRRWSSTPIIDRQPEALDLDLRISATHLRLPPFTIDDAALAVMTRNDRTEIALAEGKAYGGTAKGRFSIAVANDDVSLRGTGSIIGADASALTWDAAGRQLAAGTLNGSANFETSGDSPAELAGDLRGSVTATLLDGEISDVDLGAALAEASGNRPERMMSALHGGRTLFQSLTFGAHMERGAATIENSALSAPRLGAVLGGSADIAERRLNLTLGIANASSPDAARANPPTLRLSIEGPFEAPLTRPAVPIGKP